MGCEQSSTAQPNHVCTKLLLWDRASKKCMSCVHKRTKFDVFINQLVAVHILKAKPPTTHGVKLRGATTNPQAQLTFSNLIFYGALNLRETPRYLPSSSSSSSYSVCVCVYSMSGMWEKLPSTYKTPSGLFHFQTIPHTSSLHSSS